MLSAHFGDKDFASRPFPRICGYLPVYLFYMAGDVVMSSGMEYEENESPGIVREL